MVALNGDSLRKLLELSDGEKIKYSEKDCVQLQEEKQKLNGGKEEMTRQRR